MALAPLRQCTKPGCREYTRTGCCEKHKKEPRERSKQSQAAQQLYDYRWEKASKRYRIEHPLCAECERKGRTAAAACVDHIVPHRGDYELFWDENNWQSMCDDCHRTKTAKGR